MFAPKPIIPLVVRPRKDDRNNIKICQKQTILKMKEKITSSAQKRSKGNDKDGALSTFSMSDAMLAEHTGDKCIDRAVDRYPCSNTR